MGTLHDIDHAVFAELEGGEIPTLHPFLDRVFAHTNGKGVLLHGHFWDGNGDAGRACGHKKFAPSVAGRLPKNTQINAV